MRIVLIDSNVWNLFWEQELDLSLELQLAGYQVSTSPLLETEIQATKEKLSMVHLKPGPEIDDYLHSIGFDGLGHGMSALELLKRPKVKVKDLQPWIQEEIEPKIASQIEIEVKYAGYIEKAKRDARHLQAMESRVLPLDLDYLHMDNLRLEARQKLDQIRPRTLGQASRISGINPSDIAILSLFVKGK